MILIYKKKYKNILKYSKKINNKFKIKNRNYKFYNELE